MTRSPNYVMTVNLVNGKSNDEVLGQLRRLIRVENAVTGSKKYIKLFGRGHRQGNWRYHQSLPLPLATSADVYIYERS